MRLPDITALIIDDHPIFRAGVISTLRHLCLVKNFLEADDDGQAVRLAEQHKIDLFIIDYKMHGMNGFELTKLLLRKDKSRKIIILSSYAEPKLVNEFYEAGAKGYLEKNCVHSEIQKAITEVLSGRVYYHESFMTLLQTAKRSNTQLLTFTENELSLAKLLANGLSSKEISSQKGLALKSIETYRSRLLKKAGVKNTAKLLDYLHRHGVL
jgi:DNA-binding NarL/FixJ family response regulator